MIRPNNPPSPGRGPKRSRSVRPRKKKSGCPLFLLAWLVTVLLAGYGLLWVAVGARLLLSRGLALALAVGP